MRMFSDIAPALAMRFGGLLTSVLTPQPANGCLYLSLSSTPVRLRAVPTACMPPNGMALYCEIDVRCLTLDG